MKKIFLTLSLFGISYAGFAQTLEEIGKNVDINLYLRSSLEIPENGQGGMKANEARFEVRGNVGEQLEYRIRYRLNRNSPAGTLNNATSALDHAYVNYKFGEGYKWSTMVGKQINHYGSWEFYDNPTFEYQYSDYVNRQQNLFPVAAMVSYNADDNNSFHIQAYNTHSQTFSKLVEDTGYKPLGLEQSKLPLGVNFAWKGSFWDKKFHTFYSFTTSQVAKGKQDYKIALGNKWTLDKFSGYLDLQHSQNAIDHFNVISEELNAYQQTLDPTYVHQFAKNVQFQSVALRLDYAITPKWYITGKSVYERMNSKDNTLALGNEMNQRTLNLLGLEFKPFERQNFKLFTYYAYRTNTYKKPLHTSYPQQNHGMFAIGALWFVNAL
ncbi:porin [Bergeyella zoohelcum]|uniref:Porin domain-containing protein n=1 Tax=Bergeyella zoohelcum ATCC 43767 TaxID=883096 RepID=K1LCP4_9FLAO|nr:porin [Bergeyella zoohelcum]EKB54375.1 hypothetical protein HMPREF9699_01918 [Bergeyella zoohelcum ATCC 43767]SUV50007.1 Uncharacterised protein [Bergeyella zoohelcum]